MTELKDYLKPYGRRLENAIAAACREMWKSKQYSGEQLRSAEKEIRKLGKGKDVNYATDGIGLFYSLYYHAFHTRILTDELSPWIAKQVGPLHIHDLGSGSGATAWAARVAAAATERDTFTRPKIKITAIEKSGNMVGAARRLWQHLENQFSSEFADQIKVNHVEQDWETYIPPPTVSKSDLVVASFIWNKSDVDRTIHSRAALAQAVKRMQADNLLVVVTHKKEKKLELSSMDKLLFVWGEGQWRQVGTRSNTDRTWKGKLETVNNLREDIVSGFKTKDWSVEWDPEILPERGLTYHAYWFTRVQ